MRLLILLVLIAGMISCSVKKRTYRRGYYIEWAFSNNKTPGRLKSDGNKATDLKTGFPNDHTETEIVFAGAQKEKQIFVQHKNVTAYLKDGECNDSIFLRKGDVLRAKVIEINEKQVKYRRCDNLDGPLIVINKNDVEHIRYSNGMSEKFELVKILPEQSRPVETVKREVPQKEKKVHPIAVLALITAIVSFIGLFFPTIWVYLLAAILSGIFIRLGSRKIRENPDKYRGSGLIKAAKIISWVILAIFLVILIIVLAAM